MLIAMCVVRTVCSPIHTGTPFLRTTQLVFTVVSCLRRKQNSLCLSTNVHTITQHASSSAIERILAGAVLPVMCTGLSAAAHAVCLGLFLPGLSLANLLVFTTLWTVLMCGSHHLNQPGWLQQM